MKQWLGTLAVLLLASSWSLGQTPPPDISMPAAGTVIGRETDFATTVLPAPAVGDYNAHDRLWIDGEYLLWRLRGPTLPPLFGTVPTSVVTGATSQATLPAGSITTIFGTQRIDLPAASGGRLTAGYWLDDCQDCGIEASVLALQRTTATFSAQSTDQLVVGPLFTDVATGMPSIFYPVPVNRATEAVAAETASRLWGAELNWHGRWNRDVDMPLDAIAGVRYLDLGESLNTSTVWLRRSGATQAFTDSFTTHNHFYGGQIGTSATADLDRLTFRAAAKIALGDIDESAGVSGGTRFVSPTGASQSFPGGILTAPSNIGQYHRNRFAVLPEGEIGIGYHFTHYFRAYVAYNVLILTDAVRPANVIDPTINFGHIPNAIVTNPSTAARPAPVFGESDFWAQGINVGLEFRY